MATVTEALTRKWSAIGMQLYFNLSSTSPARELVSHTHTPTEISDLKREREKEKGRQIEGERESRM